MTKNDVNSTLIRVALVTTLMPDIAYSRYLVEAFQKFCPDLDLLVYCNKEGPLLEGRLNLRRVSRCWNADLRYLFQVLKRTLRDKVNLVHIQHEFYMYGGILGNLLLPMLIALLRLSRKRVIVTIHVVVPRSIIDKNFTISVGLPSNPLAILFSKLMFTVFYRSLNCIANRLVFHNRELAFGMGAEYGFSTDKIEIIPHGVPNLLASKTIRRKNIIEILESHRKIMLYFGYVAERKGIELLLESFRLFIEKYDDYVLVVVGGIRQKEQRYLARLMRLSSELGLQEKVLFTGFLSEGEVAALFSMANMVVLPTFYSVSASGALAIAVSFAKPVIVPYVGALRGELAEGEGIFCAPHNMVSLASAMNQLASDETLRENIVGNLRKLRHARSWSRIASTTVDIYQKTL